MKIVIVESPNKIKKISEILGKDFKVVASSGHIRDLPSTNMAIDLKHDFAPEYKITKHKIVHHLRQVCQHASCIYIATDPDREGEGIAFHLIQVLSLHHPKYRRMVFHEITPKAIQNALSTANHQGYLNQAMVDAYQARRIADRIIGYTISPLLWKQVSGAKSAGRVQSVATSMVLDREQDIQEHKSEEKYLIKGDFLSDQHEFQAHLKQIPKQHSIALIILNLCKTAIFSIGETEQNIIFHSPPSAYKTSVFQQDANKRFGLPPKKAMSIAQSLFEKGKITYHRTDTTKLSDHFIQQAKEYIEQKYGTKYLSDNLSLNHKHESKRKKGEQAAHEAIRPTDIHTIFLKEDFNEQEKKIYKMIWIQAVASLMAKEKCKQYLATILLHNTNEYWFVATYVQTLFLGFKILTHSEHASSLSEEKQHNQVVSLLTKTSQIKYKKIESQQTFTEPKKRYTEASLVKDLEHKGIGRPSTFASIINTIQDRNYVQKKNDTPIKKSCIRDCLQQGEIKHKLVDITFGDRKKRLFTTDLGINVTNFLKKYLSTFMDYSFTKHFEDDLDFIANNEKKWVHVVKHIYETLQKEIKHIPTISSSLSEKKEKKNERLICIHERKKIEFFITRYGPCLKYDKKWYDLPNDIKDVSQVSPELALRVINKKKDLLSYPCSLHDKKGSLHIIKGPYGFYLKFIPKQGKSTKDDNFFLPKELRSDESALLQFTLEDCFKVIEENKKYRSSQSSKHSKSFYKKNKK